MRIIASLLLVAGMVSAQGIEQAASAAPADPVPTGTASEPAAAGKSIVADGAPVNAAPAAPDTPAAAAHAATPAPLPATNPLLSPAFFGSGFRNPAALPVNRVVLEEAARIAGLNHNIRFRVDQFGEWTFTNQFGEELEAVVDGLGRDILEDFERQVEVQTNRQKQLRQAEFQRRQQLLRSQFQNNPSAFDTPLPANHRFGTPAASPAAPAATPAAAPAAAASAGGAVPLAQQITLVV